MSLAVQLPEVTQLFAAPHGSHRGVSRGYWIAMHEAHARARGRCSTWVQSADAAAEDLYRACGWHFAGAGPADSGLPAAHASPPACYNCGSCAKLARVVGVWRV
jgi:hypothetical protein